MEADAIRPGNFAPDFSSTPRRAVRFNAESGRFEELVSELSIAHAFGKAVTLIEGGMGMRFAAFHASEIHALSGEEKRMLLERLHDAGHLDNPTLRAA